MCLIVKELPQVCKKPITVYKEINISNYSATHLETPYLRTNINSIKMVAKPILSNNHIFSFIGRGDHIGKGFIHAYQGYQRFIPRAYIPKGAIYIIGKYYDIASTQLILDPRDVYKYTGYKFPLSDRIKFFLWRIIHLIK